MFFVVSLFELSFQSGEAQSLRRKSASYVDFPFYGSLPLNYYNLERQPFSQKRKLNFDGARSLIGHSLRVRKSSQQRLQNNFAHTLRIRRGRQWDALGHTLRIKRAINDGWKSRGYALRVRRGEEDDPAYDLENMNENEIQEQSPSVETVDEDWNDSDEMDPVGILRPRRFMANRRSADGVRIHALRVKKAENDWSKFFGVPSIATNWAKRKASLTHVLRVRKEDPNMILQETDQGNTY